ncbi:transposable element Tc1 transposase [Trichonephila clavipes]|nr:transposable element Tc1 transposase [Trichonephila clavipes]
MPRSWIAFWGKFCRVHEDGILREEDKFQYPYFSLKPDTKAHDIVQSYPSSKGNYLKVIDHLKSPFGRKDLLIEVYIRDLLALLNKKSAIKLTDLHAWDRSRLNREDLAHEKETVFEISMTFLRHEVQIEYNIRNWVFPSKVSAVETLLGLNNFRSWKEKHVVNMVMLNLQSIEQPKIWDIETNELYLVDPKLDMVDSEVVMKRKLLSVVNSTNDLEVPVPSPPTPNSKTKVSQPVKQTRCGR